MALNGRLEDMNLLEILQIVAFSKKTGSLRVDAPLGTGAVLFRRGMVLHALSSRAGPDGDLGAASRELPSEASIRATLRELFALREGTFQFRLLDELPSQWEGVDVAHLLAHPGIDPQELMLELARELDEEREDTARMLESTELSLRASAKHGEDGEDGKDAVLSLHDVTVVLVDDEPPVLQVVEKELAGAGCKIETAHAIEEAWDLVDSLLRSGRSLLLVTDVSMLNSSKDGFDGGFEIVERMRKAKVASPVVLMAESLSSEARARAKELGIRRVAFKPALTKLDPEEYQSDLRSFATLLRSEISKSVSEWESSASSSDPDLNYDVIFDFLKTMTQQLTVPANGVARMLLRVASRYVERCLLFLVKGGRARGLAGIHHGLSMARVGEKVRAMTFDVQEVQGFAEVVYSRRPVRFDPRGELWPQVLDPGRAREAALFPLLHNHEVLAIVYLDNANTGTELGKLAGLELFLVQAGMALENASLHRKIDSLAPRYSLEDQGPLTEELKPIARGRP